MKCKTYITIFLLTLTATLVAGCNDEPSSPQFVVINIREVSDATGINEQIKERTEKMNQQLREEMKVLADELSKRIEDEEASLVDNPSEDGSKKLQTLRQQLNKQLIQASNDGKERLTEDASKMRQAFLDDITSVAQKVALKHGASIILKDIGVVWTDGSTDITDKVINLMSDGKTTQPADGEEN